MSAPVGPTAVTSPTSPTPTGPTALRLDDADYQARAHAVLLHVETTVDRWLDTDVIDIDTHRTGGLLELHFPGGSKIIINTQPPLQEIWLAAKGGGFHYRLQGQQWQDTRTGEEFLAVLSHHASVQAGQPLRF